MSCVLVKLKEFKTQTSEVKVVTVQNGFIRTSIQISRSGSLFEEDSGTRDQTLFYSGADVLCMNLWR